MNRKPLLSQDFGAYNYYYYLLFIIIIQNQNQVNVVVKEYYSISMTGPFLDQNTTVIGTFCISAFP